jgi:hypothetical protein
MTWTKQQKGFSKRSKTDPLQIHYDFRTHRKNFGGILGVKEALVGSRWLNTWVSYAKYIGHTLAQASWVILFSPNFIDPLVI